LESANLGAVIPASQVIRTHAAEHEAALRRPEYRRVTCGASLRNSPKASNGGHGHFLKASLEFSTALFFN
jgi:hypothetical protein